MEDINNLGMETFDIYNTGESISQGSSGPTVAVYDATGSMATAVGLAIPSTSTLSVDNISKRAQAMTCGGCHQTSTGDNLGTQFFGGIDLMWPIQTPSFMHIDNNSNLSTALTMPGGFLDRRAILEDFLDTTCGESCLTDPIVVLVTGELITKQELDKAFADEEAELEETVLAVCGPKVDDGSGPADETKDDSSSGKKKRLPQAKGRRHPRTVKETAMIPVMAQERRIRRT